MIDRTFFMKDQSDRNGKGNITPFHYFGQLLSYDENKGKISLEKLGESFYAEPKKFSYRAIPASFSLLIPVIPRKMKIPASSGQ